MGRFFAYPAKQPYDGLRVPFAALRGGRHPSPVKLGRDGIGAHAITIPHNIEETQAFRALCRLSLIVEAALIGAAELHTTRLGPLWCGWK
jgi:hypothetical protein